MKKVTIDLETLSAPALDELAMCSTDKSVLQAIYEIAIERNNVGVFLKLARNHSPAIKEILEKICRLKNKALDQNITRWEFASNPYTPEWVLARCLGKGSLSSKALYNPNTPAEALNKRFPELLNTGRYACERIVSINGNKLREDILKMIIEKYPDYDLPKQILKERKNLV